MKHLKSESGCRCPVRQTNKTKSTVLNNGKRLFGSLDLSDLMILVTTFKALVEKKHVCFVNYYLKKGDKVGNILSLGS